MVKVETITNIEKILDLLSDQNFGDSIQRYRAPYLYRGSPK